jgi:ferredoxin-NADP reductase
MTTFCNSLSNRFPCIPMNMFNGPGCFSALRSSIYSDTEPVQEKETLEPAKSSVLFRKITDITSTITSTLWDKVRDPQVLIPVALTVVLLSFSFFPALGLHIAAGKGVSYAVARAAGAVLKHLLPLIFIPTLRMCHAKIRQYCPNFDNLPIIGKLFHNRISLHKFLGTAFISAAAVHTIAHGIRHSVSWLGHEGRTGFAMIGLMAIPIAAMYLVRACPIQATWLREKITWLREKSYHLQFLIPHQLGWWGLMLAYAVHTQDYRLLYPSLGIAASFCIDRIWEWKESRTLAPRRIEKIHDEMILMEIDKPQGYEYKVGQKAYLASPPWRAFVNDLHPFTIASDPDEDVLRFVISASGKWTRDLIKRANCGEKIRITPAFPSSLDATESKSEKSDRLLITSGAGIAMTLAHLNNRNDKSTIHIIHTGRHREEFALLNKYLTAQNSNVTRAEYYDTNKKQTSEPGLQKQPSNATLTVGRFNPHEHPTVKDFEGRVYFCGNEELGKAIEKDVSQDKRKIFHREKFNF